MSSDLFMQSQAMLKYAFGKGLNVSSSIVEIIQDCSIAFAENKSFSTVQIKDLTTAHNELSTIVSPAKPSTLALFEKEENNTLLKFLGPVALVRRMVIISILALIALIALGISPQVDGTTKSFSLVNNDGLSLLFNQLFLISASAIGASFSALFKVNSYIKTATYERMYESTYWIRFVLGILAGTMLATLIPIEHIQTNGDSISQGYGQPLLALIGGFSASVVFRILMRITNAIETIFKGDTKEIIESKILENNIKLEQINMQNKLNLAVELKNLQNKLGTNTDISSLVQELDSIQEKLLSSGKGL